MRLLCFSSVLFIILFFAIGCAPSGIRVSVTDVDANEVLMQVEKISPKKKWPPFTLFVYEDEQEEEFKIQTSIDHKTVGECAYDATCYQFVVPWNNHGLKKRQQQFSVSIINSKCEYPLSDNNQEIDFIGRTKENRKGYDLMLNDDIGEPAPYEYSRGSFYLNRENPYPDPISIELVLKDPDTGLLLSGADVSVGVITDKVDNQLKIKELYPDLECFDKQVWREYKTTKQTNSEGEVLFGNHDDLLYVNPDGSFLLELSAEKDNRVPISATLHGDASGAGNLKYTVLWPSNPNKRSIIEGYYFPDIIPE